MIVIVLLVFYLYLIYSYFYCFFFFFSSRRRHTRCLSDWSSDVCSSDLLQPEVLLLDEPCSGLDPISTARIEEALYQLKADLAVILVTNNVKQAARASDWTAFFLFGEMIEISPTGRLFTTPQDSRTADYI